MNKSPDISTSLKPVGRFFQRFHLTIFIVVIVGGLAYAVVSLYTVLSDASTIPEQPTSTVTTTRPTYDQTTIDHLNQLYTAENAPGSIDLPAGRINPFSE